MTAAWVYPPTTEFLVQGRDLSEDNFAQESRSSLEIMVRETLQNPLDVRATSNSAAVQVRIQLLKQADFDVTYLAKLLPDDYLSRLKASGVDPIPSFSAASVLVVEDFGTTGLEGHWEDQNADGPKENWNAFWFREGEGAKSAGSNGRAGQGKITYYRIGATRAVFGFTVRESDGKQLLMGRAAFRRVYPYDGTKFLRHSFWSSISGSPRPVIDKSEMDLFRGAFNITRDKQAGLSLVIPFPNGFDPDEVTKTIVTDFYYPVARGRLEVSVNGKDVSVANIEEIADLVLPDELAREKRSSFTKGFRNLLREVISAEKTGDTVQLKSGWDKTPAIAPSFFPDGRLEEVRGSLEKGARVSVRCPVTVKPKGSNPIESWFDVHLQLPEDLDRVEEAYLRRDLLIGSESHLSASAHLQKARAITIISDESLSAFLADAEEPTHLKWNASRPRLSEDYTQPQVTLRAVRQAAPRLLALLSSGVVKQDVKALARYFTKASDEGKLHAAGGKNAGGKPPIVKPLPEPTRKPFRISAGKNFIDVLPNGAAAPKAEELPLSCMLEVAYEGLDSNSFASYDPFDFDLGDAKLHPITAKGTVVTLRRGNKIEFEVIDPQFSLHIPGFDQNIRLRARLHFTEVSDGTVISEE